MKTKKIKFFIHLEPNLYVYSKKEPNLCLNLLNFEVGPRSVRKLRALLLPIYVVFIKIFTFACFSVFQ